MDRGDFESVSEIACLLDHKIILDGEKVLIVVEKEGEGG